MFYNGTCLAAFWITAWISHSTSKESQNTKEAESSCFHQHHKSSRQSHRGLVIEGTLSCRTGLPCFSFPALQHSTENVIQQKGFQISQPALIFENVRARCTNHFYKSLTNILVRNQSRIPVSFENRHPLRTVINHLKSTAALQTTPQPSWSEILLAAKLSHEINSQGHQ